MINKKESRIFPDAAEDARSSDKVKETKQTLSPSYRLAYRDQDFLLKDELRHVRLELEMLKPDLILKEKGINSTIVVFGSSRIPDPETAKLGLEKAEDAARQAPEDIKLAMEVGIARRRLENSRYYTEAREFAQIVSSHTKEDKKHNYIIITGGGPGIMEAANKGADEIGALNIGLNIVLPEEQVPNKYITPELCFQFHYFGIRKLHFLMRAKALVVFPGGFGTLDELFDALTLIQTKKVRLIPVLLFGSKYWKRLLNFTFMVDQGVINPDDIKLFQYVETAQESWDAIRDFYEKA